MYYNRFKFEGDKTTSVGKCWDEVFLNDDIKGIASIRFGSQDISKNAEIIKDIFGNPTLNNPDEILND